MPAELMAAGVQLCTNMATPPWAALEPAVEYRETPLDGFVPDRQICPLACNHATDILSLTSSCHNSSYFVRYLFIFYCNTDISFYYREKSSP